MAWSVSGNNLQIVEGDYGIELPVTVTGTTLSASDTLRFIFKSAKNGTAILTKEYSNAVKNTVNLVFSDTDTALFSVGEYVYSLDWYHDGVFMCNIVACSTFKVVDKA